MNIWIWNWWADDNEDEDEEEERLFVEQWLLLLTATNADLEWCQSYTDSDVLYDQTEVALQKIRPVSDLGPHMEVCDLCCSHCYENNRPERNKSDLGHFCLQSERSHRVFKCKRQATKLKWRGTHHFRFYSVSVYFMMMGINICMGSEAQCITLLKSWIISQVFKLANCSCVIISRKCRRKQWGLNT